jgi:hypothetical protein
VGCFQECFSRSFSGRSLGFFVSSISAAVICVCFFQIIDIGEHQSGPRAIHRDFIAELFDFVMSVLVPKNFSRVCFVGGCHHEGFGRILYNTLNELITSAASKTIMPLVVTIRSAW